MQLGKKQAPIKDLDNKRNIFLAKASIFCTTLSTGASKIMMKLKSKIDYLIVDEACQCSELAALAPLVLNPKRVVLVGDHKQLPATIFSDNKDVTLFERSLFERLHTAGLKIYTLTV